MPWPRRKNRKPTVAVVFGSGGARGWAHVGVLRALRELEFAPDLVVGTSIGSVAAAVHATGALPAVQRLAEELDWLTAAKLFFEIGLPRSGLLEGRRVMELLRELLPKARIDELAMPYAAVATDLHSQREVVLSEGSLLDAIRASISIPGVFTPVLRDGAWLVDGGLVNPLPVSVARAMGATQVVAVDINLLEGAEEAPAKAASTPRSKARGTVETLTETLSGWIQRSEAGEGGLLEGFLGLHGSSRKNAAPALIDVVIRSLRAGENAITRERLLREPPDVLIQPAVGHIGTLEFHRSAAAIEAGYTATLARADALRALL